ncbi:hypothetical protein [Exiguobacterium sp. s16]|uniref:hypothetical protein n=1 Tax=Exiguobacterium sp. s16 TaxID=2751237 RepID=UPI001BE98AAB|nr:hypothetical protein [Exiguobacterium sp. s16]
MKKNEFEENVDYKVLLTLLYLKEFKDAYLLSEIKELCNFSTNQLEDHLNKMVAKNLLNKSVNKLSLSDQSLSLLRMKGLENITISDLVYQEIVTLRFIKEPLSFSDIYIPSNFKL